MFLLNESGDVAASGITADSITKGFLYSAGTYTELLPPGWLLAQAVEVNSHGTVVGWGRDQNNDLAGFLYDSGQYTELRAPGATSTQGWGINDAGIATLHTTPFGSFLYSDGQYTALAPPGFVAPKIADINESGAVVGFEGALGGSPSGFLYSDGEYVELLPPGWDHAAAYTLNENGAVIGHGYHPAGAGAFLYSEGEYSELAPPATIWTHAEDINESGIVVGTNWTGGLGKGFVYQDGTYYDLLPLCWSRASATHVNNDGVVVGWGRDESGVFKGFVADPELLPEEQVEEILEFFDDAVAAGELVGVGPGNSAAKRLNALRNMLVEAGALLADGLTEEACEQLEAAYRKCDGHPRPPDFVEGPAASELALLIQALADSLGCE